MRVLEGLKPQKVWYFFEDLCGIPHGSYHEKQISDYCAAFARKRGLQVRQDEANNVVIVKPASAGYEEEEPVVIQGHLDMVCEKDADCGIDFEKDGLSLKISGDYVYAEGTTLGGDDGIAIAYALAILDDESLSHPRIEAVFTTAEEVGMDGAMALDTSDLKGKRVLNLDSEEEGELLAGCAGGSSDFVRLPLRREKKKGTLLEVTAGGLKGGHSGTEIHKGRANANMLLSGVLGALGGLDYRIVSFEGGQKENAIPRKSRMELLLQENEISGALSRIRACEQGYQKAYGTTDPGLFVKALAKEDVETEALTGECTKRAAALLLALPDGVQKMSGDVPGLVETSLNLGVARMSKEELLLQYSVRSSIGEAKTRMNEKIGLIAEAFGATLTLKGVYPAWEFRKDSPLREKMVRIYQEMFGKEPSVGAIHAGLECGLLSEKIEDMDCVSFGPDILDIHTTNERLSISSVERTWDYILEILRRRDKEMA